MITGESGTGKELAAEALHYAGERKEKPLVKVNCSALSESLLESELFGHVKGAFTGAIRDKVGRFQLADGGTIFLDEIGDISLPIQQRLLRVLQERELSSGWGNRFRSRWTYASLRRRIRISERRSRPESFREDLYYRLKVVEVAMPPLRERREDIPLLVDHFIKRLNLKLGKQIEAVSEDVLGIFMRHPWRGNVRELEHTLEHAFILCRQNTIMVDHLPADFVDTRWRRRTSFPGMDRWKNLKPDHSCPG